MGHAERLKKGFIDIRNIAPAAHPFHHVTDQGRSHVGIGEHNIRRVCHVLFLDQLDDIRIRFRIAVPHPFQEIGRQA